MGSPMISSSKGLQRPESSSIYPWTKRCWLHIQTVRYRTGDTRRWARRKHIQRRTCSRVSIIEIRSGRSWIAKCEKPHCEVGCHASADDFKETYEVGSESNEVQYNIWLPEAVLPGFRTFSTKLYWELHRTSMRILDAMIMALNLSDSEGDYVRSLHSGHGNQLRFSHYPPVPIDKLNKEILSRLPAHTDWRSV